MTMIRNPILRGFNPDPSICRVGDDYYIATSTFEWYPGVQIHHSRDLAIGGSCGGRSSAPRSSTCAASPIPAASGRPVSPTQTASSGSSIPTSSGFDGDFKDAHNYLVTAPAIEGPWSDPAASIRAVSIPRSFTTTTDANGSST